MTAALTLAPIQWLNAIICAAAVVVTFFAMVRMRKDETELQILLSFPVTAAGMFGVVASYFRPGEWQAGCDTLLFGGVLAFMIGSRRHTHWISPRWMRPMSVAVSVGTVLAFLVGVS